jgi:hypothetical protein
MNDSITSSANLLSLGMVFPTVILGSIVLITWYPSAIKSFRKIDKSADDWFILGVFAGFIGAIVYSLYWFIFWLSNYMNLSIVDALGENGVIVNICSRQIMGMLAAYCFIKASELSYDRGSRSVNRLVISCNLVGVALMIFFFIIKEVM